MIKESCITKDQEIRQLERELAEANDRCSKDWKELIDQYNEARAKCDSLSTELLKSQKETILACAETVSQISHNQEPAEVLRAMARDLK